MYSSQDAVEESEYRKDDGKLTLKGVRENVYGQGIDDVLVTIVTTVDGKKKTENRYFYQKNQLGSITAITDEKGKVVEEYRYDVFGKAYVRDGKSNEWREFRESKVGNSRLFTGREYDGEVGLYYYRARFYSAEMGRFVSRDPIGTADNVNLYTYVGNSPVMYHDPRGTEKRIVANYFSARNTCELIGNCSSFFPDTDATDVVLNIFGVQSKNDMVVGRNKYETSLMSNDLNPALNVFYKNMEYGADSTYDFALNGNLNKQFDSNRNGQIFITGKELNIGEVSNVLTALNAYRLGFSQEHLEYGAMTTVQLGQGNGTAGEMADRVLYSYGYELGRAIDQKGYLDMGTLGESLIAATNARTQYLLTH